MSERSALQRRIRGWLVLFLVCLVLSGLTAFPLVAEVRLANSLIGHEWLTRVGEGLDTADAQYPFLLYGNDWLAFAHLVIAVFFYGVLRDPVRNVWILEAGMIACAGVVPLALICGQIRDIPFGWRLIDISFGVFGIIPLLILRRLVKRLEALPAAA
ncbi:MULTISPECIES: hypothetical protein [Streptomyces]|uniref:hypothetical protein n=1 Tax=Streptomyces TaxID=1883 RepID=UPI00167B24A2|nr:MULTISPECIES: hypothetical protein [Streptomyces]MBD3578541.1 hypothetical protein [Streptomyces sp. KD18]GGT18772.1 hypothetical protein GCM10010286_50380 [Streptomyces toxytricini]